MYNTTTHRAPNTRRGSSRPLCTASRPWFAQHRRAVPTRNQTSSATATYDDANRKTNETVTYSNGSTLSYAYAYSPAGYKTQLTWPDGSQIGYSYSGHGELESVTIPNEGTLSVNQFKWTAPATLTLPGGTTQERTLDGLLKLEGLKVKTPGQQTVLSLANTYGKVQELKQSNRTDTANGGSTSKASSYAYDDEVRLTQATTDSGGVFGADTETYTLDAVGNRIAHSPVSGAWTYDANNRLTQRGEGSNATTYAYDEAGNQTKKTEGTKVTQYGYDTQNRLIEVKDGANNLIARYGYDPLGRRMWKEQYRDGQGNVLTTQKRTHYLYADEGLIAEATQDIVLNADNTVTASGTPQIVTQYGPKPNSPFTTGMLFITTKNSNGTDTVAYYHHDHLQTPQQATDKAGNVVWAASYNAFGQAMIVTSDPTADRPTITSNLRLPGQYFDEETGLHQNYFRDYDPATGRYLESDPIGLKGGINTFAYVEANPLSFADPSGLYRVHGNYCGPDWTGGHNHPYRPTAPGYYHPPTDYTDAACERHDKCFEMCREMNKCDKSARAACMTICNRSLADDQRLGASSGTSIARSTAIWLGMQKPPDPGDDDQSCDKCGRK